MDHATFMRAICAAPADDGPRLVYADWLEEQGEGERAFMIRRGCQFPTILYADNLPHRINDRGSRFESRWTTTPSKAAFPNCTALINRLLPAPVTDIRMDARFRRGFLDYIECPGAWWLRHADAIRAAQPVTRVRLTTWPNTANLLDRLKAITGSETDGNALIASWGSAVGSYDNYATRLLQACWLGIAFELPRSWNMNFRPEVIDVTSFTSGGYQEVVGIVATDVTIEGAFTPAPSPATAATRRTRGT